MATTRSFRSKPLNALDLEYEQFSDKVLELAFKSPEQFFWLRRELMKNLLDDTVQAMYNKVFNLLTQGSVNDDGTNAFINHNNVAQAKITETFGVFNAGAKTGFNPKMSEQKADAIALGLVDGLQGLMRERIVDELLPKTIFNNSLERAGKAAAMAVGGGDGGGAGGAGGGAAP